MTNDIALVLGLLAVTVTLFVLEKPRADVVALMLLGGLAVTGLVEPQEALSGFSSPAVVTVWAVFILSGGLSNTGVANLLGRQILKLAGGGEIGLTVVIMLVSAFLSAFMNNVGATALLLPVVMDLARRTGIPPSKLLIPLSFSSLLGGMLTLIGTPPNILIAEAVSERGIGELGMFSFTPLGGCVVAAGILYMVLIGRHLLPARDLARDAQDTFDLRSMFGLQKRLLILHLPEDSALDGRTVAECRIQQALGLTVIGIIRSGRTRLAPAPNDLLQAGDRLLVEGRPARMDELRSFPSLSVGKSELTLERAQSTEIELGCVTTIADTDVIGKTLRELDFRHRSGGAVVLAIRRRGNLEMHRFDEFYLEVGDVLVLQASAKEIEGLLQAGEFGPSSLEESDTRQLDEHLMRIHVPEDSFLADRSVEESKLGKAFGLMLLSLNREDGEIVRPTPQEVFRAGDSLVVKGDPQSLEILRGLQALKVERRVDQSVEDLESAQVGLAVVAIAPNARGIAGKTPRDLHFREKYGLSVLAIWRQGRLLRRGLASEKLVFGDALLLHGPRQKLGVLAKEPDFLVLSEELQPAPLERKAPVAVLTMVGVLAVALSGWLPIYIAAVIGATVMILTGCLTIQEAYREIEWRAVFLIAGMLPLGIAMEKTGAALFLTDSVVALVGGIGAYGIMGGLFLLAVASAQVMPTPAVAVLLAPIAMNTAANVGISPLALVMAVAVGANTSFISPVTHPANVLVMGPGGYRFIDYVKVGVPLALVTFLVVMLALPVFWPL